MLSIFEPVRVPSVEPFDTNAWLAATAGETLIVTAVTGQELSGDVVGISPDTLSVSTDAGVFDIDRRDVSLIRRRFADPLGKGTHKGLWAGAGVAIFMFALVQNDHGFSEPSEVGSVGLISRILAAGGMAIGRAVDSLVTEERVIHRTPARPRTTLAPLLSSDAIGAGVTVSWWPA